jgi:hypothetical protein
MPMSICLTFTDDAMRYTSPKEHLPTIIEAFNKALELHPKSGAALCGLALCKFYEAASANDVAGLEKSFELIQKAASIDYTNASILGKGKILGESH